MEKFKVIRFVCMMVLGICFIYLAVNWKEAVKALETEYAAIGKK